MIQETLINQTFHTKWTLYGAFESFSDYKELFEALHEAKKGDIIILEINSPGGRADIGMMLINAIKHSEAITVAHIVFPSASMASLIAMACSSLVFDNDTYLMFHTYTGGSYGKSDDLIQDVLETHRCLDKACERLVRPFLTKAEVNRIREGKDFYIRWDDINLKERIKRHYKVQVVT